MRHFFQKPWHLALGTSTSHNIIMFLLYSTMKLLRLLLVFGSASAFVPSSPHSSVFGDNECRHRFCTETRAVSPGVNVALVSSSVALLSGYHIRLAHEERKNQEQGDCVTWRQYQADAREQWARHVK